MKKKRGTTAKKSGDKTARKKKFFFGKAAKIIGAFTLLLAALYVSLGYHLDKGFLKRDLEDKYGIVMGVTTLSVRLIGGPPHKPVLTAVSACENYAEYVMLSWSSGGTDDYYDIEKNGNPLVSGATATGYRDDAVAAGAAYTYTVTAFNSFGQTTSDPANVTVQDCGSPPIPEPEPEPEPLPAPTCEITRFQNTSLSGFSGIPETKERQPRFYGTTNMPNAKIQIVISGETSIVAETSANANGFWLWKPQSKINYGLHNIEATAIDQSDPSRSKADNLAFRVKKEKEAGGGDNGKNKKSEVTVPSPGSGQKPEPAPTLPPDEVLPEVRMSTRVTNTDKVAYPGSDLDTETRIETVNGSESFEGVLHYSIVTEKYEGVFDTSDQVSLNGGGLIEKKLPIPRFLEPGNYKVLVDISRNGVTYITEDSFLLKEIPLFSLGGIVTITAAQVMNNLFWVILWLIILLVIFLILLFIEWRISERAIIPITEEELRKKGLITRP